LRFECTRVVQAARENTNKRRISFCKLSSGDAGSTFRTKTALVFSAPETWREIVAQLSVRYSHRASRDQERRSVSTPSDMLTIPAMAF